MYAHELPYYIRTVMSALNDVYVETGKTVEETLQRTVDADEIDAVTRFAKQALMEAYLGAVSNAVQTAGAAAAKSLLEVEPY